MTRQTTTLQIQNAIKNNYLHLEKAKIYNKSTQETETIPNNKFMESFDFFCESGLFMDAIGWHFEKNHNAGNYEIECSRMDGSVDVIITAYFRKSDDVNEEDIERALKIEEE